jgi:ribonuclease G
MAKNLLVINVDIRETRVALIENGIIAELHIERETSRGTLGNIYLGKVSRVLPGMQAAFIDVGLERAAFLHVEDLIRPDDFEAYLSGHRHAAAGARSSGGGASSDEDRSSGPTAEDAANEEAEAADAAEAEAHEAYEAQQALAAEEATTVFTPHAAITVESVAVVEAVEPIEPIEPEREVDIALPTALEVADNGDDEVLVAVDEATRSEEADAEAAAEAAERDAEEAAESGDNDDDEARADDDVGDAEASIEASAGAIAAAESDEPTTQIVKPAGEAIAGEVAEGGAAPEGGAAAEEDPLMPRSRGRRRGGRDARVRRSRSTRESRPEVEGATATTPVTTPQGAAPEGAAREPAVAREGTPREGRQGGRDGNRQGGGRDGNRQGGGRDNAARAPNAGGGRDNAARAPSAGGGRDNRSRSNERSSGGGGRDSRAGGGARDAGKRGSHHEPPRVSKTTPIREVVREGQEVLVQISKEPIGTKGARVTSHISLPGRYVVYLPTVDHVGISKRIGSDRERSRLREAMEAMKPPQGGLIVRTVAEGLTKKQLKADVGYLVRLWGQVVEKRETGVRAPACLYTELDLVLKTARDLFTDDIEKIVIDSAEEYHRLRRFVEVFMPERVDAIELYEGQEPIFDAYGIEDEIQRAQSRKVPLPSGGHLIIDQAEALTAIDVNTGRFVGKGSKDLEETILATNMEAVEEIAYQLRFRNIGGLIILDLIDMERATNREKVRKRMEDLLAKDKAKTTLNRISDLGLIEMTRKRTRESLGRTVLEPCFYCDGTGQLQSKQTIAYEILRQIRRERMNLPGYIIIVNAHPAVIDLLKSDERVAVTEAERLFQRRLELIPRKEYHLEQFDLQGR